jgi:cell division protein FtsW
MEHSILLTATLCLLAAGAVMVYSASSAETLLDEGDPAHYLKRYVMLGAVGLAAMHAVSRVSLRAVRACTPLLLAAGFALTAAVMVPGVGVTVNGATRWLGAGPLQFQPSEVLKIALVLYAAQVLAARPREVRTLRGIARPVLIVVGAACLLLIKQPDMGTAIVVCLAIGALMLVAGAQVRHLASIAGGLTVVALVVALVEPYRRERLTAFLDPWKDAGDSGFQAIQAMIAMGSGGPFGVGLGESVQKIYYLPEAHTDMILAVIGEELGVLGVAALAALYGLVGYAGLRAAKLARNRYAKLVGAGLTGLIMCQATLNFFAVMGMAPLTGVPLPFISYGNSNLIVLLAGMGVLLRVASTGGAELARPRTRGSGSGSGGRGALLALDGGGAGDARGDRGGRDSGTRRAGAGDRRRAAR